MGGILSIKIKCKKTPLKLRVSNILSLFSDNTGSGTNNAPPFITKL